MTLTKLSRVLLKLMGAGFLMLFVGALLMPGVRSSRPAALRAHSLNSMRNIGVALMKYSALHNGHLPPAYTTDEQGNKLHSWRTLILPYMDETALFQEIDLEKPWDDPVNELARQTKVPGYWCPVMNPDSLQTTYMAITASGGMFSGPDGIRIEDVNQMDGQTETLMLIEVPIKHAVHWMEPIDADERLLELLDDDHHHSKVHVIYADGHSETLPTDIDRETLKKLITCNGGEKIDPAQY